MENPFSWEYLTAPVAETAVWGPFSVAYVILFGFTLLASAYLYYDAARRFENHKLKRDTIRAGTQWLMWITAIGLLFFVVRYARIELLTTEKRIWMYLMLLGYLAVIGYFAYYLRTVFPGKLAAFEKNRARRKYISPATGRAARVRRSSAPNRRRATR